MDIETILTRQITGDILNELRSGLADRRPQGVTPGSCTEFTVPVGISNRHVHLSRQDMDILFGPGSELTRMKAVKQPGQFAAKESVTLRGPKGELERVRILGTLRAKTQVEISHTDGIRLGLAAPLRMSGNLDDTPGAEIIGPGGTLKLDRGVIVAWRHVHMLPETAAEAGFRDGDVVEAVISGERAGILGNVVVRAVNASALELHIDVEEANAFFLHNNDTVSLRKR
jgi:propanediol utilization protein